MGRKDNSSSAAAAEAKLLEFTALMNHDYSQQRPGGPRAKLAGLQQQQQQQQQQQHSSRSSTAVVTGSKPSLHRAAATDNNKPRRINTARSVLPILNLAKVRHNLADEAAELATAIDNDQDEPLDLTKQAKTKLNVQQQQQFLSASSQYNHLQPTSAQTQSVGTHVMKPAMKLRGMTAPAESGQQRDLSRKLNLTEPSVAKVVEQQPGRGLKGGFSTVERMQLEEKLKLKLKTPRPLPEDITAESEACHRCATLGRKREATWCVQ